MSSIALWLGLAWGVASLGLWLARSGAVREGLPLPGRPAPLLESRGPGARPLPYRGGPGLSQPAAATAAKSEPASTPAGARAGASDRESPDSVATDPALRTASAAGSTTSTEADPSTPQSRVNAFAALGRGWDEIAPTGATLPTGALANPDRREPWQNTSRMLADLGQGWDEIAPTGATLPPKPLGETEFARALAPIGQSWDDTSPADLNGVGQARNENVIGRQHLVARSLLRRDSRPPPSRSIAPPSIAGWHAIAPADALLSAAATPGSLPTPSPTVPAEVERVVPVAALQRLPGGRPDLERLAAARSLAPTEDPESSRSPVEDWEPLREWVRPDGTAIDSRDRPTDALQLEYTLHPGLSRSIFGMLEEQEVALGQVLVAEARTGRILAYTVTDPAAFGPARTYPAASLAKVVTAAAALDRSPEAFQSRCVYDGSPSRLPPQRIERPRSGQAISFPRALATSNNQCFGQLAVDVLGRTQVHDAFERFGWLAPAAPGYPAGRIEPAPDNFSLAELGSGLSGSFISPLHALQLALTLVDGHTRRPFWIERVRDASGQAWTLPDRAPVSRAMPDSVARTLRAMLVETTTRGTARRAFRIGNGKPLLQEIRVAGKTGSLRGENPDGRYEWFAGVAPADDPSVAIVVLSVHGNHYLQNSSQLAAEVLRRIFCPKGLCTPGAIERWRPAHEIASSDRMQSSS